MRILLVGRTGLIGSAISARLSAEGHECVLVSRHPTATPGTHHIVFDMARTTDASRWKGILAGVDAVINAAGALQGQDMQGVHVAGSATLYSACESAGIRRVILFSAIGTDRDARSDFSRTKQEGEAALMARNLDWVVLRPSVVVGRPAYGGSALLRGLASLPALPDMPDTAAIQPVYLDDVVETVLFFLQPGAPSRIALDLAGPRQMAFSDAVALFRRWLRWRPAHRLHLPAWAALAFIVQETWRKGSAGARPSIRRRRRKCGAVRPAIPDPGVRRPASCHAILQPRSPASRPRCRNAGLRSYTR
ncbi:NAD(P)H-binding protein [Bradyrhizobium jicamae]|uniref:NAD(P)H-binding protein n=1 Tax=Bradyrhizobium jicamae TaxID=280332 RepID=UPI000AB58CED